jgi:hypothetical protein
MATDRGSPPDLEAWHKARDRYGDIYDRVLVLPSPSMGEGPDGPAPTPSRQGKGGGAAWSWHPRQTTYSPPSQPFPATASAEGAQVNVPPSPTRGKERLDRKLCFDFGEVTHQRLRLEAQARGITRRARPVELCIP